MWNWIIAFLIKDEETEFVVHPHNLYWNYVKSMKRNQNFLIIQVKLETMVHMMF